MNEALVILRAAVWPLTVLFIAIMFRAELRKAIGRLVSVQYGDFQASFEKQLKRAETAHGRTARGPKPSAGAGSAPGKILEAYCPGGPVSAPGSFGLSGAMYRLAIVAPREAITRAWAFLERLVFDLARTLATGTEKLEVQNWEQAVARLVDRGALPPSLRPHLDDLRALATKLAHTPLTDPLITPDQARRYIDLTQELAGQIKPRPVRG